MDLNTCCPACWLRCPAAVAWLLLEVVVHILARGWIYRTIYPNGAPLHKKGQREASRAVTSGVVKLVSTIHNAIQVSTLFSATGR